MSKTLLLLAMLMIVSLACDDPADTSSQRLGLVEVQPTAPPANRMNCALIQGTSYLSETERDWYLANCVSRQADQSVGSSQATSGCPQGCASPPSGCVIKGNVSVSSGEKIYHVPGGGSYAETVISPAYGERWFCTEQEAVANGWRKARN